MPLTSAFLSDRQLGLRHRAAIGITEDSDAIALVVSEERGTISIAHDGRIIRGFKQVFNCWQILHHAAQISIRLNFTDH
mgnify:CR=1 FL=1